MLSLAQVTAVASVPPLAACKSPVQFARVDVVTLYSF